MFALQFWVLASYCISVFRSTFTFTHIWTARII
ncbi:uncharacterized protein DEA37_0002463 [Paragonimus westermani]|uniref:Uncharacterized protein n=1 Tax=Paragonimus westermani TaxID=34504 RepID=A0A5J4N3E1_9TREM|nr:uncharacterized protein DEA37_0002463 [Paragonimus westermani]